MVSEVATRMGFETADVLGSEAVAVQADVQGAAAKLSPT